jgi:hypothetical protein
MVSMFHRWLANTDGTGATVRAAFRDYREEFDLVDHQLFIAKLFSLGVRSTCNCQ